jgi:hypothetical protein
VARALQRFDILVSERLGEFVASLHWQRADRMEFVGAAIDSTQFSQFVFVVRPRKTSVSSF